MTRTIQLALVLILANLLGSTAGYAQCSRMTADRGQLADKAFAAAQMFLATPPGMVVERNIAAHGEREYELRKALSHRDDLLAPTSADGQALTDAIDHAAELRRTEEQIEAIAPGLLEQLVAEPLSLAQVQAAMQPGQGLLMLLEGQGADYAWMVTRACVNWVQLDDELVGGQKGAIDELRRALVPAVSVRGKSGPASRGSPSGKGARHLLEKLHRGLLGPFSAQLEGIDELFVHGSSRFLGLPFAALVDPADGRYEVEKRGFALIPSLRALVDAGASSPLANGDRKILAMGAPDVSLLPDGRSFSPLPGARRELKDLRKSLGERVRVFEGAQATRETLRSALADSRSDVLLFSTHAVLDGAGTEDVGLLLSGGGSSRFADLLSMDEIAGLALSGQLVILSACDTWSGKPGAQEALNGLALAFLSAGARDLVVTQWPISDQSAGRWSHLFLNDLEGGNVVAAVRSSQIELMRFESGRWADPRYWASYIPVLGGRQN